MVSRQIEILWLLFESIWKFFKDSLVALTHFIWNNNKRARFSLPKQTWSSSAQFCRHYESCARFNIWKVNLVSTSANFLRNCKATRICLTHKKKMTSGNKNVFIVLKWKFLRCLKTNVKDSFWPRANPWKILKDALLLLLLEPRTLYHLMTGVDF